MNRLRSGVERSSAGARTAGQHGSVQHVGLEGDALGHGTRHDRGDRGSKDVLKEEAVVLVN